MRTKLTQAICFIIFAMATAGTATAQFTISGEFRPRAEYRDGYLKMGDSSMTAYTAITGRSRIIFDYSTDKIQTRFSLQHAFVFGENPYSSDTITKNTVNIFEGWFRYNFTKSFAVRVGRMGLSYDDMRIFGYSNWSQWGATHDLVNLEWNITSANYLGNYGFAVNNTAPATAYEADYLLKNYKYMTYLYEQKKFFKEKLTLSLIGVIDAYQLPSGSITTYKSTKTWVTNGTDTVGSFITKTATTSPVSHKDMLYARGTVDLTAGLHINNLNVFLNGIYQTGHYKDGRKISAYFYGGWVSYAVIKPLTLLVGYEALSGNKLSDTTELKSTLHGFSTLFGTKHAGYGYMDAFQTYLGQDALQTGLNDLYGRVSWAISKKTNLEATYRSFSMPYGYLTVKGKVQSVSTSLGSELDLMFVYKPMTNLELNAAYCYYFKNTTRELVDGLVAGKGRNGEFAYVMVTYKPNFFTSEKK